MQNIEKVLKEGTIDKIIDSYTEITNNGKPLLTKEEAQMFKDYLHKRAQWFKVICDTMIPTS